MEGASPKKSRFKSKAEKDAVVYGHLASKVNCDQGPMTVDDILSRNEAMAFLHSRLDKNPRNAMAHHYLAPLVQTTGDIRKAVTHHQCAVTYNSFDLDAMNDTAIILYKVSGFVMLDYRNKPSIYWVIKGIKRNGG